MSLIRSLGYLRVEATDLEAWRMFGAKVLSVAEGRGPNPQHLYLRTDELSARIVVEPGGSDRLAASGWEVADHASLVELLTRLKHHGVDFELATAEELAERRVQEMVRVRDPFGNVLELFHGATYEPRPAVTPYGNRFVTGDQGLGHVVLPVDDDARGLEFYGEVLGFRLRDSMRLPAELVGGEKGDWVWLRFLGTNPRHHSLALAPLPAPSGCIHMMLEVTELDDVGRALERAGRHGVKLGGTLGRHMNDDMVSFYLRSPSGFDVEYGWGGLRVEDDATWVARESTAVSRWGHAFAG